MFEVCLYVCWYWVVLYCKGVPVILSTHSIWLECFRDTLRWEITIKIKSHFDFTYHIWSDVLVVLTLDCVSVFWITLSSQSSMSTDVVSVCKRKAQLTCSTQLFSHAVSLLRLSVWLSMNYMHHSRLACKLLHHISHGTCANKLNFVDSYGDNQFNNSDVILCMHDQYLLC